MILISKLLFLLQIQTDAPVPADIPLPLPLPKWLLVIILVLSFLLHIIFVSLMIGGVLVSLWAEIKGLKNKDFDKFALEIAKTITVNKSLAVVLGVAPLLSINVLYTVYFYSSNALTGLAWILLIPLITIAFLLTYLHKYTWELLKNNKILHISILVASALLFLFIPLIFLTNVNLMLFPEKWGTVKGFLSALLLPNVFPRYFEFIGSTLTITGFFIVWYNSRKYYDVDSIYTNLSRTDIKRYGYTISGIGLVLQIVFGIILMLTLPSKGFNYDVLISMIIAGSLLSLLLWYVIKTLSNDTSKIDIHLNKMIIILLLYIITYGSSRQLYRHNSLKHHQELMAFRTKEFMNLSKEAQLNPVVEEEQLDIDPSLGEVAKGAALFKQNCGACHKQNEKLVGPPMTEMVSIYTNNIEGLKNGLKVLAKKDRIFHKCQVFLNYLMMI